MGVVSDPVSANPGGFVHLHLHTEYSLLDGGNRIDRLVVRVAELGMSAVGVTDHGNLFGAVAIYQAAREKGIKPILGVEAYVAPGDRRDRTYTGVADGGYHLVLLAENQTGWNNLLYLCSEAYLTGFYFKPRIDHDLLEKHADGLIAINGHLGSEIAFHLTQYEQNKEERHYEKAREVAQWHARVFNKAGSAEKAQPRFYLELQHHIAEQNAINKHIIRLAQELSLPLVCDNDSHFLLAGDHDAHDTLICISMGKVKKDPDRFHYPPELYVKSAQEMRSLFEREYGEVGREACDNTVRIGARCDVTLPLGGNLAPMVRIVPPAPDRLPRPDDPRFNNDLSAWYREYCAAFDLKPFTEEPSASSLNAAKLECDRALRMLAEAGMTWRYGVNWDKEGSPGAPEIKARLERELKILADKGISPYFLIVWDFVNWGRQRGIPALARGSGVGTMVGYVLGLSNACPVQYGLLFERFTDPDRSEFPDIDIDLCQDGRASVIDYVRAKYGHVAQIITFGTLKARAAVRDVGRVLEMPLAEVDALAKLIPEALGMTLDAAIEQEPDLRKLYQSKEEVRRVIDNARTIEGQARHASVHAAGVIVATRPLHEIVPLYKQSGAGEHEIVTQWDGPTCEKMGLLKMDFLGLRTLSVIERAKVLIREGLGEREVWNAVGRLTDYDALQTPLLEASAPRTQHSGLGTQHPLDLDRLSYADPRVFELFQRADTTGVFQFESGGMRRLLVEMKPDRLEDLIAANALFRPGPMDLIPDYNRRKHGQDLVPKVHPIVDQYTAETYGVMVYQEQVMQIVHGLGGIPLRAAYSLIKAISKKKEKIIEAERPKFMAGAMERGLDKSAAERIFEDILKFAGYGFNKSHSTGYAIVAYQTAYLKTYFPNQYMAAFLTYESGAQKVSDWVPYLEDCKRTRFINGRIGVEVRPPDVNLSRADFTVVFDEGEPRDSLHGHVRFGLKGIKGVGEKAIDAIVTEREHPASPQPEGLTSDTPGKHSPSSSRFTSLFDFCERILSRTPSGSGGSVLNKAAIEALVRSGAMDSLHSREARAAMLASIEPAVAGAQKAAADKAAGQGSLFGGGPSPGALDAPAKPATINLVKATPWTEAETLAAEKETLGLYLSSHPLQKWASWSHVFATTDTASIKNLRQDQRAVLACLVQSSRSLVTRNGKSAGQKMAIVTFEDLLGSVEGVLFSDCYAQFEHLLKEDAVVFLLGRVDRSRGDPQVIVERIVPIDGVPLQPGTLRLIIDSARLNGNGAAALQSVAGFVHDGAPAPSISGEGDAGVIGPFAGLDASAAFPLEIVVDTGPDRVLLAADSSKRVQLSPKSAETLTRFLGEHCVKVVGGTAVEVTGAGRGNGKKWASRAG